MQACVFVHESVATHLLHSDKRISAVPTRAGTGMWMSLWLSRKVANEIARNACVSSNTSPLSLSPSLTSRSPWMHDMRLPVLGIIACYALVMRRCLCFNFRMVFIGCLGRLEQLNARKKRIWHVLAHFTIAAEMSGAMPIGSEEFAMSRERNTTNFTLYVRSNRRTNESKWHIDYDEIAAFIGRTFYVVACSWSRSQSLSLWLNFLIRENTQTVSS